MQDISKKTIAMDRRMLFVLLALALALGMIIGSGIGMFGGGQKETAAVLFPLRAGGFKFISPLIDCESNPARELKPFRYKVTSLVTEKLEADEAAEISVYFRDLNNGHWFGINENDKFSPSYLLKIPVLIAYLKRAESNPLILKRRLPYAGSEDRTKELHIRPVRPMQVGQSYTVDNLILRMTAYADENAFQVLSANLPAGSLNKIFADLDIDYDPLKQDDALSLTAYASFYRVLFNASYLNREMSEKALEYLSNATIEGGIAAGVPPGVTVASKFGERTLQRDGEAEGEEIKQLHEFGIIYYPGRPYLLGVMVRGNDFKKLEKAIREISHTVYQEVYRQSP